MILREIKSLLEGDDPIPAAIVDRLVLAALIKIVEGQERTEDTITALAARITALEDNPSIIWYLRKRTIPTLAVIVSVFAVLTVIYSDPAARVVFGLLGISIP